MVKGLGVRQSRAGDAARALGLVEKGAPAVPQVTPPAGGAGRFERFHICWKRREAAGLHIGHIGIRPGSVECLAVVWEIRRVRWHRRQPHGLPFGLKKVDEAQQRRSHFGLASGRDDEVHALAEHPTHATEPSQMPQPAPHRPVTDREHARGDGERAATGIPQHTDGQGLATANQTGCNAAKPASARTTSSPQPASAACAVAEGRGATTARGWLDRSRTSPASKMGKTEVKSR